MKNRIKAQLPAQRQFQFLKMVTKFIIFLVFASVGQSISASKSKTDVIPLEKLLLGTQIGRKQQTLIKNVYTGIDTDVSKMKHNVSTETKMEWGTLIVSQFMQVVDLCLTSVQETRVNASSAIIESARREFANYSIEESYAVGKSVAVTMEQVADGETESCTSSLEKVSQYASQVPCSDKTNLFFELFSLDRNKDVYISSEDLEENRKDALTACNAIYENIFDRMKEKINTACNVVSNDTTVIDYKAKSTAASKVFTTALVNGIYGSS